MKHLKPCLLISSLLVVLYLVATASLPTLTIDKNKEKQKMGLSWNSWYNPFDNIGEAAAGAIGNAISTVGTVVGAPEMGISEGFTGNTVAPSSGSYNSGTQYPIDTTGFNASAGTFTDTSAQDLVNGMAPYSSGGTTGGTSYAGTGGVVDPYAGTRFGSTAGYNNVIDALMTQKQGIMGSGTDAINAYGSQYGGGIMDWINSFKNKQQSIDNSGINNELAKQQGTQGIMGMVGRGVRSGGVMLSNKNANDSSASQALAQAYGDIGRRNMAGVGNQYELGNRNIGLEQTNLQTEQGSFLNQKKQETVSAINSIVTAVQDKLYALEAQAASVDLPGRLAIEQEKQNVRNQATQALQAYDQQLQTGMGGVTPMGQPQRQAAAAGLATAGYDLGKNAFNYTTQAPGQFQGNNFASDLPIFTFPNSRKTQTA